MHPEKNSGLLQILGALFDQVKFCYNYDIFVDLLMLCDTVYGYRPLLIT